MLYFALLSECELEDCETHQDLMVDFYNNKISREDLRLKLWIKMMKENKNKAHGLYMCFISL